MDRQALLDETFGLLGMIGEVRSKAALLKRRAAEEDPSLLEEGVMGKVRQMHRDLATYSGRVKEIYQELSEYGHFSGVDSQANLN